MQTLFQVGEFIRNELLAYLYQSGDTDGLMEESADAALLREQSLTMYHACKEALHVLSEVDFSTLGNQPPSLSAQDYRLAVIFNRVFIFLYMLCSFLNTFQTKHGSISREHESSSADAISCTTAVYGCSRSSTSSSANEFRLPTFNSNVSASFKIIVYCL